ncbi:SCP2 sterol-binding domain-containing protein [bacterium]|nr:SCP2 sterol-binding domain-containing protein [bacterium]
MPVFESTEKLDEVLGGFFQLLGDTPMIADKLLESNMIIRFSYTDPDLVLVIDCTGDKLEINSGDTESKATVEMKMRADIGHKFWFGKVNLTMALARRKIVAKGSIPKTLKLLPAIKPSYALYPEYLEDNGFGEYNIH